MKHRNYFFTLFLSCSIFNIQANDGFYDALEMKNGPREIPVLKRFTTLCLLPAFKQQASDPLIYSHAQNLLLEFNEKQKQNRFISELKKISLSVEESNIFMHIMDTDQSENYTILPCTNNDNFIDEITECFEKLIGNNYKHERIKCTQAHLNDIERPRKRTREE